MHSGRLLPLLSNTKRLWFSLRHSFKCTQHSLVADAVRPAQAPNWVPIDNQTATTIGELERIGERERNSVCAPRSLSPSLHFLHLHSTIMLIIIVVVIGRNARRARILTHSYTENPNRTVLVDREHTHTHTHTHTFVWPNVKRTHTHTHMHACIFV